MSVGWNGEGIKERSRRVEQEALELEEASAVPANK